MKKTIYDFDKNMGPKDEEEINLNWFDAKDSRHFTIYGSTVLNEDGYSRFSLGERQILEGINPGEAGCSEHCAGVMVKFITDATDIFVKVTLKAKFDMTNMTQLGQCGMDLYNYDENLNTYVFHNVTRYPFDGVTYKSRIGDFRQLPQKSRSMIINFPLYMPVCKCEIGINTWANLTPDSFKTQHRITVYGTSITHGCSASHPGMAYTNILSRRLDTEFLNLGFSGSAMMEGIVADFIGNRKTDMLIIDTEPNAGVDKTLKNNCCEFLDRFYALQPNVPVIIFTRMPFAFDLYDMDKIKLRDYYKEFLQKVVKKYKRKGYKIYFADQSKVFGKNFTEYTADGIHPNDIGMVKIADLYEQKILNVQKLLKE